MPNPSNLVRPPVLNVSPPQPAPSSSNANAFNMDQLTNIITGIVSNILKQEGRNLVQTALNPNANFTDVTIDSSLPNNITELDKIPDVVRCLREFSGNPGEFNSWRKSVDRILQIYEPQKGTPKYYGILNVIRNKIVGNADIALESYNTPLDWKAISRCLTLHYADKRDIGTLEYQMTSLVQGNLTIQEFYQRVYSYLSLILNKLGCMEVGAESMHLLTRTYRDKALDTFILKGDLPRLLGMRQPVDLPQALHLCLKLENQNFRSHHALASNSQNRKPHDFRPPLPPKKPVNEFYPQLAFMPKPYMQAQNIPNYHRPQAPINNYRNYQPYRPLGQPPTKPQPLRPEPMDVDRSFHSRAVNYMNRPQMNNQMKRPSNFSQQVPVKQQRNFRIEAGEHQDYYQQDPQYNTDQYYEQDWTPTPQEYEAALTAEENGQSAQTYAEGNSLPEIQGHIDIHFLE